VKFPGATDRSSERRRETSDEVWTGHAYDSAKATVILRGAYTSGHSGLAHIFQPSLISAAPAIPARTLPAPLRSRSRSTTGGGGSSSSVTYDGAVGYVNGGIISNVSSAGTTRWCPPAESQPGRRSCRSSSARPLSVRRHRPWPVEPVGHQAGGGHPDALLYEGFYDSLR